MRVIRKSCLILIVAALVSFSGGYSIADDSGKININTATAEELLSLKEIGIKKANAIVAHRALNGPFEKIEDLKDVIGIGDKVFEKIKDLITVGEEE